MPIRFHKEVTYAELHLKYIAVMKILVICSCSIADRIHLNCGVWMNQSAETKIECHYRPWFVCHWSEGDSPVQREDLLPSYRIPIKASHYQAI